MRWKAQGVDIQTGLATSLVVEAGSEPEAAGIAGAKGMRVMRVTPFIAPATFERAEPRGHLSGFERWMRAGRRAGQYVTLRELMVAVGAAAMIGVPLVIFSFGVAAVSQPEPTPRSASYVPPPPPPPPPPLAPDQSLCRGVFFRGAEFLPARTVEDGTVFAWRANIDNASGEEMRIELRAEMLDDEGSVLALDREVGYMSKNPLEDTAVGGFVHVRSPNDLRLASVRVYLISVARD